MPNGNGIFGTNIALPEIRPVQIQPAGIPGSTFVRPQQREVGGNLARLADALGSMNSALAQYGSVAAAASRKDRDDPDSEANRAFADEIAGLGLEGVVAKYPEAKNRIQKDAALSLVGSKAAYDFRQHITEQYNSGGFGQAGGDFNAWVEGERQKYAGGLNDPAMQAAFFRGTDNWVQQFGEQDLKRKVENMVSQRDSAVVDEFRLVADDALTAGKSPEETAQAIIDLSGKNRTFRGLDGKSQNDTLFRLATEYALKGRPELVKALLNNKRGTVGPLINVSEYSAKGLQLIKQAEAVQQEESNEGSFFGRTALDNAVRAGTLDVAALRKMQADPGNEWLTDAKAAEYLDQSMGNKQRMLAAEAKDAEKRRQSYEHVKQRTLKLAAAYGKMKELGGAQELQDVEIMGRDGNMVTLTAGEQQKEVVKRMLSEFAEMEETALAGGATPQEARQETMKARIAWFDGNGIVDEDLQKKFNASRVMSSISRVLQKGEGSGYLSGIAEDFRQLDDINPAYAEKVVTDGKALEFLQNYSEGRKDRMGEEDALLYAGQMTNRTAVERARGVFKPEKRGVFARSILRDYGLDDGPNGVNAGWVYDQLDAYAARSMTIEQAYERITEKLDRQAFEVNGVMMVMDDPNLPPDTPELLDMALNDAFEALGKAENVPDVLDLYLETVGSGQWLVMSRSKGNVPLNRGSRIDLGTLNQKRSQLRREAGNRAEALRVEDVAQRKAARDARAAELAKDLKTVEGWERKAAKNNRLGIPAAVAKRLRAKWERDNHDFLSVPETPAVREGRRKKVQADAQKKLGVGGMGLRPTQDPVNWR